jgi:outer membrane immunogenic protein
MRMLIRILALLAPAAVLPAFAPSALAQSEPRAEVAVTYAWVHTNAPPGGCGCFSMNGANGSFAYRLTSSISVVGEAGAVTAGNVDATGLDLTLADYLAGARYSVRHFPRLTPFAQVLLGDAHASGGLSPGSLGIGSSNSFAMTAGGGLDVTLTHHFALRVFQTDYYLTLLPNRDDDHQNNFRFSAGIVYRFGGH